MAPAHRDVEEKLTDARSTRWSPETNAPTSVNARRNCTIKESIFNKRVAKKLLLREGNAQELFHDQMEVTLDRHFALLLRSSFLLL